MLKRNSLSVAVGFLFVAGLICAGFLSSAREPSRPAKPSPARLDTPAPRPADIAAARVVPARVASTIPKAKAVPHEKRLPEAKQVQAQEASRPAAPSRLARLMKRLKSERRDARNAMSSAARVPKGGGEGDRGGFDEWFSRQRAYPADKIPVGARDRALEEALANNGPLYGGPGEPAPPPGPPAVPAWTPLGPSTIPDGQTDTTAGPALSPVSGRLVSIAVHPTDRDVVYAAGAQGGVWKSTNARSANPTWTPLTDHQASLAIGSIAIDPVNPNIIYAGTGEPHGSCDSYYGRGILRSADGGATWTVLGVGAGGPFDGQSISKVLIDPASAGSTTSTTLWASTALGFTTSGTQACQLGPGVWNGAVWRSTDSGLTWSLQDVPTGAALPNARIHDMVLHPTNSDILYVAVRPVPSSAAGGIWKSVNAKGSPAVFAKLAGGFPDTVTANPGIRRIRLGIGGPAAPNTLYAAMEGVTGSNLWGMYRTTNGGTTWSHIDNGFDGTCNVTAGSRIVTHAGGDPFTPAMVGQRLIVNNSISRTVTSFQSPTQVTTRANESTFPATLSGTPYSSASYPKFCDGQCFYNVGLGVDPTDATGSRIFVGGNPNFFNLDTAACATPCARSHWRSTDGGDTWRGVSQGDGTGGLHVDGHIIAFDPSTTPARVYDGNDGGIWRSDNSGISWVPMNTNISITQFQSVGLHPSNPNVVIGGTQDNGTNIQNPALQPLPKWFHSDFGDGGQSYIDQGTPERMFHTYFNASFAFMGPSKSTDGGVNGPGPTILGGSWDFVGGYYYYGYENGIDTTDPVSFYAPIAQHPATTPNIAYFGSNKLYRSPDPQIACCPLGPILGCDPSACTTPPSWTVKSPVLTGGGGNFVSAIGVFPNLVSGNELIYTGSSDGRLFVSSTVSGGAGLATWTNISGSPPAAPLPLRFVTEIEVAASDATGNTAYVSYSGFNATTPTRPGHLFRTTNGLSPTPTWTNISGDLPDIPANAIAIDPTRTPNILYVGTDIGVFQSVDDGAHWSYLTFGHPVVAVFGLDRNPTTGQIVSSTHGRGMFQLVGDGLADTTNPVCGGSAADDNTFNGTALDAGANDTGIASIVLLPGSVNLVITSIVYSGPGSATYVVETIDDSLPGTGTVRVTDFAGNFCDQVVSLAGDPGQGFFTVTPCRTIDTRGADAPALVAGSARTFFVTGDCGIPSSARTLSTNITITQPTADGNLRVDAGGAPPPTTSVINYRAGQTRANNALIRIGPGGTITVYCDQALGTVEFILDVNGYFE